MKATKGWFVLNMTDLNVTNSLTNKHYIDCRKVKMESTEGPRIIDMYISKRGAEKFAGDCAIAQPTKLFVVLETVSFFETTRPDVIEKEFNEQNEFVLKAKPK